MVYQRSLVQKLSYLSIAVRTLLTSLAFSAGVMGAPVKANAVTVFDFSAFPGLTQVFGSLAGERNALPIEAVQPRELSEQEILLEICEARGYAEACAKALLGMMWKESLNDGTAVGDNGKARGYFQIHYRLHKVDIACAEDLRCSAEWSLDYLESNGYPKYPSYAVQCHNGCNADNGYAASALRHGERLWNQDVPQPKIIAAK
jgi:hypothetical protein